MKHGDACCGWGGDCAWRLGGGIEGLSGTWMRDKGEGATGLRVRDADGEASACRWARYELDEAEPDGDPTGEGCEASSVVIADEKVAGPSDGAV